MPDQPLLSLYADVPPARIELIRAERYSALFATPLGRQVLADIIASSGLIAGDTPHEPHIMAFRNGARWQGSEIVRLSGIGAQHMARAIMRDNLNTEEEP